MLEKKPTFKRRLAPIDVLLVICFTNRTCRFLFEYYNTITCDFQSVLKRRLAWCVVLEPKIIEHLMPMNRIISSDKRLCRICNRTPTVRLRIISQIRFVIWAVFETVYDNA